MDLFRIRPAREDDLVYLDMVCDEHGLGRIEGIGRVFTAVNDDDIPVGFIRIKTMEASGENYVYPVAVFSSWQCHGVGSALIGYARQHFGTLKLVACTESQDFYPKLGFEPIAMSDVAESIARDCELCSRNKTCIPQAFVLYGDPSGQTYDPLRHSHKDGEPHRISAYETILGSARKSWSSALENCTDCGKCASRCELFDSGIESMSDIARSGMELLATIAEPPDVDDAAYADIVRTHISKHQAVYALTRRCCLCNNCTARCCVGIRADRIMRPWRALYQLAGLFGDVDNDLKSVEVDRQWHLFSVYRHLNGVVYPEFPLFDEDCEERLDTLFFPGCTMVSYMDDLVRATGSLLNEKGYRWALSVDCCGSPLLSRGLLDRVDDLQRRLLERCLRVGIKKIVTVCSGCEMELLEALEKQGIDDISVIPLPRLLADTGEFTFGDRRDVALFDSCHDRDQRHGVPLREMFAGCGIRKLEHEGCDTLCCGAGGAVSSFDAALVDARAKRILGEARSAQAKTLITSCPTCAYTFAYQQIYGNLSPEIAGIECRHYLELLFGIETDWSQVFARAEWMWTGEHSAWVISELM